MLLIKRSLPVLLSIFLLFSCKNMSKTGKGAIIGTAAGAGAGAIVGKLAGNTLLGTIVGAAVGGTAGALIGKHMDKQAEELQRDLKNAKVERVGEGIKITFDSGILFDVNSSTLRSDAQDNIQQLAKTLNKYSDTNVLVEGHTDDTGKDDYNQKLSERRAFAVSDYTKKQGVADSRITTAGYGEKQPISDNTTVDGRQKNRRVEIAIFANEKMKKAAKNGDLKVE
jgi:outer membrane protein OmpA-like peptidoglycan-associated protein